MKTTICLAISFVLWTTSCSRANCPLCLAPTQTWAELVAEADVVVLARLLSFDKGSDSRKPSAQFRVVSVHNGEELIPGRDLHMDEYVYGKPGETFLLRAERMDPTSLKLIETFATETGQAPDGKLRKTADSDAAVRNVSVTEKEAGKADLQWDAPEPVTSAAYRYVVQSPAPDMDPAERLKYFLRFLEHTDPFIAGDAWGEFAKAEYEVINGLSHLFSSQKLRGWIVASEMNPERLNLYGLMLGMCGGDSDAVFLKQQIGPASDDLRFGVEGLMGGLMILDGEKGLRFVEETRLEKPGVDDFEVYAAVQAVHFAWNHEAKRLGRQRIRNALHLTLQNESIREIAIRDLARWEDWTLISKLPSVYAACRTDDPRTTQAIIGYIVRYQKSHADSAAEGVATAMKLLDRIRSDSPGLVRTVERQLN